MPRQITIPNWQRRLHFWSEVAALAAVPFIFSAARSAREPHKSRLKVLGYATIAVDGFLVYRWLKR